MLLPICSALLAFFVVLIILHAFTKDKIIVEKRMSRLISQDDQQFINVEITQEKKDKKSFKIFSKFKMVDMVQNELMTAGILMRAEEFATIWVVSIFVPSTIAVIITNSFITATSLIIAGAFLPPFFVKRAKKKRMEQFSIQLGDALVVLGNCLRSGISFQQGIESIASEMPDPIGREFTKVVKEIKYGSTVEKALNNLVNRINSEELELIVSAIIIQREVGGNLSEILDNISHTIKERLQLKDDIKVITATGRTSGMVVGFMPIVIGLVLMLATPSYISLFFETQSGIAMLVGAGVLEAIGFTLIQKIVTVKY